MDVILIASDFNGGSFIGLGEVNLDHLTVFPRFNPYFFVLPNPISCLLLELLSSLQNFLDLREAFLRDFSSLSNFLLNWATTA
jgi:hypothetical protein